MFEPDVGGRQKPRLRPEKRGRAGCGTATGSRDHGGCVELKDDSEIAKDIGAGEQ